MADHNDNKPSLDKDELRLSEEEMMRNSYSTSHDEADDHDFRSSIDSPASSKKRKSNDGSQISRENVANDLPQHDHDNVANNPLKPGSRILSSKNVPMTVTVDSSNFKTLLLSKHNASFLANEPSFKTVSSLPSYEKTLLAFDEFDKEYKLLLSVHIYKTSHLYKLTKGWDVYAKRHNLIAGDEVKFYRVMDERVSDDFYYVLRCSKKPKDAELSDKEDEDLKQQPRDDDSSKPKDKLDGEPDNNPEDGRFTTTSSDKGDDGHRSSSTTRKHKSSNNDQISRKNVADLHDDLHIRNETNINPLKPGSRRLSPDKLFMSKYLSEIDKLVLDSSEGNLLAKPDSIDTSSPLSYLKTLLVYDESDKRLNLMLSVHKHMDNGRHKYKLSGQDWDKFVNMNKLTAGDTVQFYRIKDDKVSDDYYYALRCFKILK